LIDELYIVTLKLIWRNIITHSGSKAAKSV